MATTEPPEPDWVVEDIAARGEITQLWGAPGIGKSLLVEALCAGVGHGRPVAGLACKLGTVVYVDAENGQYEVHRRVHSLQLPPEQVAIYDGGSAHLKHHAEDFNDMLDHEKPDLLVLDSLRRLTAGTDENESGAMAEVLGFIKACAQEYDLAVLIIHHARKDGATERGSSAIKDQVSISWRMDRDQNDRAVRRLSCEKMRIAAEPGDRFVRVVATESGGLAVQEADQPAPLLDAGGAARQDLAARILELLDGKKANASRIAEALGQTRTSGTVRRALDELEAKKLLRKSDDGKYRLCANVPTPAIGTLAHAVPDSSASGGASGTELAHILAPEPTRSRS
jgi:predicted ATP-dependent serine protease